MDLKIKALSPKIGTDIPLPYYATPGSAAMDLHACLDGAVTIPAGERRTTWPWCSPAAAWASSTG